MNRADPLGRLAIRHQVVAYVVEEAHRLESGVVLPPCHEIRIRHADILEVPLRRRLIDIDEPLRLGERQRPEKKSVEDAEDGGVSGDAERKHPDHHGAERPLRAERAESDLQIVPNVTRHVSPSDHPDMNAFPARRTDSPGSLGSQFVVRQFFERDPPGFKFVDPRRPKLPVAILEMLAELLDNLGLPRAVEFQLRQPTPNRRRPIRHIRYPSRGGWPRQMPSSPVFAPRGSSSLPPLDGNSGGAVGRSFRPSVPE